jgi:hypothetical protein
MIKTQSKQGSGALSPGGSSPSYAQIVGAAIDASRDVLRDEFRRHGGGRRIRVFCRLHEIVLTSQGPKGADWVEWTEHQISWATPVSDRYQRLFDACYRAPLF